MATVLHIEDAEAAPVTMALASRSAPGGAEDIAPGEIVVATSVRVGYALTRP